MSGKCINIKIRRCTIEDLKQLQNIGYETYDETFRKLNSQETIDKYLQESFNKEKLLTELNNQDCQFYFLFVDNKLTGYLKINDTPAQSDINDAESIEIERIYVRKQSIGKGLGKHLMNFVFQLAKEMDKQYVWLGVWEKNVDAIIFYIKMGFYEAGRHTFKMGHELQNDWIMKKEINIS